MTAYERTNGRDPLVATAVAELDEPTLPVFLINGCPNPFNPGQPASFYTTDPGKALVTGLCSDPSHEGGGSQPEQDPHSNGAGNHGRCVAACAVFLCLHHDGQPYIQHIHSIEAGKELQEAPHGKK